MNRAGVGLHAQGVGAVFPFHFAVDRDLHIIQAGNSLARLLPQLASAPHFLTVFAVMSPHNVVDAASLHALVGRLLQVKSRTSDNLVLRGQFTMSDNESMVIFVGSPVVTCMSTILDLGLTMRDFAVQDPVSDYLLLLQSQATSLQDATNLADAFAALNQDLEERVMQRTCTLAAQTAELEHLNGQLRAEIEDRHRIEAELRLAQKLESVGQLAAGIAHEINTPIQFIGDNLRFISEMVVQLDQVFHEHDQLIADPAPLPGIAALAAAAERADLAYARIEIPTAASQALEGVERVATLVRALKEFSHPDAGEKKPTDLNQAIRTTTIVARNEYKYVAELALELAENLPSVLCSPGEINQVLLNLIVNAAHAIDDAKPTRGGGMGMITISTRLDGDFAEVRIRDTGTGIPSQFRDRIFDPFFTTKPVGKGTGQGLSLARSIIVGRHQGTLTFETVTDVGTTFIIRLALGRNDGSTSCPSVA